MRIGSVVLIGWLVIGAIAGGQHGTLGPAGIPTTRAARPLNRAIRPAFGPPRPHSHDEGTGDGHDRAFLTQRHAH
ncbi:MAG: hypothetical protein JWM19_640 [Actinomycetia bacterium]|nr:hypothetical protein [Actinomycetes bacterium]